MKNLKVNDQIFPDKSHKSNATIMQCIPLVFLLIFIYAGVQMMGILQYISLIQLW